MSSFINVAPEESIKVLVRVRPNDEEKSYLEIQNNSLYTAAGKCYSYDFVESSDTTQEEIFDRCYGIFQSFIDGYNGTIFAYGQTSSGKTFTMTGVSDADGNIEHPGLIPRGLQFIFNRISEQQSNNIEYLVKCSFVEIYNEQVYDLLDKSQQRLNVRVNIKREVYIEPLNEIIIECPKDAENILKTGLSNRHVGSTAMNRESSRSHSVFSIILESRVKQNGIDTIKRSCLHLVDLAGSERQKDTKSEGVRLKEAVNINQSLLTLGNVMRNLVEVSRGKSRHVTFRQSKLTLILKDAIGGNSKTMVIACINPNSKYLNDTLKTLAFANNAKCVKNKAKINLDTHGDVESLSKEVTRLREQLNNRNWLPLISETELQADSLWKTKFITSMILRSCSLIKHNSLQTEMNEVREKYAQLENTNKKLIHSNFKLISDLKEKVAEKEASIVTEELLTKVNELLELFGEKINIQYSSNVVNYRNKIESLQNEVRHLEVSLKQTKLLCNASEQTIANNIIEDYNKLVKEESVNTMIHSVHKFSPDLIKLQDELVRANQTINTLRERETKIRMINLEEKSALERELNNWKNKFMVGEEYATQVNNMHRRLTGMIDANAGHNCRPAGLEGITTRKSRQNSRFFINTNIMSRTEEDVFKTPFPLRNTDLIDPAFNFNVDPIDKEEIKKNVELQAEKQELEKKYAELTQKYDELLDYQMKYEKLKLEYESKEIKIRDDEILLKQLQQEKNALNSSKDKKIESLYEQITELQSTVNDIEIELSIINEQNEVLREENECLKSKNLDNINKRLSLQMLQENLSNMNELNQRQNQEEIERLNQQITDLKSNNAYMTEQWQSGVEESKNLKCQIESLESDIADKEEEIDKLVALNMKLENNVNELKNKEDKLETDYNEKILSLQEEHKLIIDNLFYEKNNLLSKCAQVQAQYEVQRKLDSQSFNDSFNKMMSIEDDSKKENPDDPLCFIHKMMHYIDTMNNKLSFYIGRQSTFDDWLSETLQRCNIIEENCIDKNLANIASLLDNYRDKKVEYETELRIQKEKSENLSKKVSELEKMYAVEHQEKERMAKENNDLVSKQGHNNLSQKIRLLERYKSQCDQLNSTINGYKQLLIEVDMCLRSKNLLHVLLNKKIYLEDWIVKTNPK